MSISQSIVLPLGFPNLKEDEDKVPISSKVGVNYDYQCEFFVSISTSEIKLKLDFSGFKTQLYKEDFDQLITYQIISSKLEKIEEFSSESSSLLSFIQKQYQSEKIQRCFGFIDDYSSNYSTLKQYVERFSSSMIEFKKNIIPDYEITGKNTIDCDLIVFAYEIVEKFKYFKIEIKETIPNVEDIKNWKANPLQIHNDRRKTYPLLYLVNEKFSLEISKIQHSFEVWQCVRSQITLFFMNIYKTISINLSLLPPIVYEESKSIVIEDFPNFIKKRILAISINITETIKSHKIIQSHEMLKEENGNLKKENQQLKKLFSVLMIRGALEKSITEIKLKAEKNEDNSISNISMPCTTLLDSLSKKTEFDKYWTGSLDSTIEKCDKKKLRSVLPQIYQTLSEVIHRPEVLDLDISYPIEIKAEHVGNSKDKLIALREIIQHQGCNEDEDGNILFKFK
jgi:hypothetical protein